MNRAGAIFLLFLWMIAVRYPAPGQSTFGTVLGTVMDASGAVLPGAKLTLRDLDEATAVTAQSNPQGFFEFLNIQPGRYQLSGSRSGFATQATPEFVLQARETRRADLTLNVAPRTDATVVTTHVRTIDTENGTVADSKNFEEITRLPLNYRAADFFSNSALAVLLTVPGIQQDLGGRLSLGGGLPAQVEVSLDGVSVVNVAANLPNVQMTPSPETLAEFRVTSLDGGAAFGQMGDVAMVTRAGTNQLHGSVFWYHQNRALDATTYSAPVKQQKVFNTFGASLGGPVQLPGIYSGRSRTFFFVDYEGIRRPQTTLQELSVPTQAMHGGDLQNVPGPRAVDPSTGAPFPGNKIPDTQISSVARNLLDNYYPLPNVQTPGVFPNYLRLGPMGSTSDGYDLRIDHVLNSKQRVFGRWSSKQISIQDPSAFPAPDSTEDFSYQNFVLSHTFAPGPTISNELRLGFSRVRESQDCNVSGKAVVAQLGLVGLNLSNVGDGCGFPGFVFEDETFSNVGAGRSENGGYSIFQYTDTLSWIHGRHAMKFGGEVRRNEYRSTLHIGDNDDFGEFYFSSGAFSGNEFADLLLGLPFQSQYAALGPNVDEFSTASSFFAQDNWRANRRLTFEFGLRWEVHPPFQEAAGNITNFDHQNGNVIIPDHSLAPAPSFLEAIHACSVTSTQPCTRILTASQVGLPQGLRRTYYGDWDPRFGFAWQPWRDGRTVIRGGIGRYTQSLLGSLANGLTGVHSSDLQMFANYQGPNTPPLFTFPNVSPPLSELGEIATESFQNGNDPTLKDPDSYQWNFTIERELPWSTSFRVSHVGVQSGGMPVRVDFNQVPASTIPYSASRVPFQQWTRLISDEGVGFASYEGLQMELLHRVRNGISFQASYVLAKNLGEAGTAATPSFFPGEVPPNQLTDRFNTRYDRGNLPGSRRNHFLLTGLFSLPFGRGRAIGANWRGLKQGALGGWELSTVSMIESGPYQTPTISPALDQSNTDVAARLVGARPDRVGNGNLSDPTPSMYYDQSAFIPVPSGEGRFGNAGSGILEGPGTIAISAGLAKSFPLTEKLKLRAEATFTNLPNHPNFLPPSVNISSLLFGKLTQVQSAENSGNRTGQVALRLDF